MKLLRLLLATLPLVAALNACEDSPATGDVQDSPGTCEAYCRQFFDQCMQEGNGLQDCCNIRAGPGEFQRFHMCGNCALYIMYRCGMMTGAEVLEERESVDPSGPGILEHRASVNVSEPTTTLSASMDVPGPGPKTRDGSSTVTVSECSSIDSSETHDICKCGNYCPCDAGECGDSNCPSRKGAEQVTVDEAEPIDESDSSDDSASDLQESDDGGQCTESCVETYMTCMTNIEDSDPFLCIALTCIQSKCLVTCPFCIETVEGEDEGGSEASHDA